MKNMSLSKQIDEFHFSDDESKKSRILAIIHLIVGLVLALIVLVNQKEFNFLAMIAYLSSLPFSIILIIKPQFRILWAFYFLIEGFALLLVSDSLIGIVVILAGFFIFIKLEFFRKYKRYKIPSLILVFILAIFVFYYKNDFNVSSKRLLELFIWILLYASMFFLMYDDLKQYYRRKPKLNLNDFELSKEQRFYIEQVTKGKSLNKIAKDLHTSESVVKREIKNVYVIFDVNNFNELIELLHKHEIEY